MGCCSEKLDLQKGKVGRLMQVRDIWSMLEQFLSEGFSLECLSKVTDTSIDVINRCYNREKLSQNDMNALREVLWFLTKLYCCNTEENEPYLQDVVSVLCDFLEVSRTAIAKHLGISEDQLNCFLNKPEEYPNGFNITIKLLHLFNTVFRDKKY